MTKNEMRAYAKRNKMTLAEVREFVRKNAANDNPQYAADVKSLANIKFPLQLDFILDKKNQTSCDIKSVTIESADDIHAAIAYCAEITKSASNFSTRRYKQQSISRLSAMSLSNSFDDSFAANAIAVAAQFDAVMLAALNNARIIAFLLRDEEVRFLAALDDEYNTVAQASNLIFAVEKVA
jgi:hypothetical protein